MLPFYLLHLVLFAAMLATDTRVAAQTPSTLTETVAGNTDLSTLQSYLTAASLDLNTVVAGVTAATLFAPTNAAFTDLQEEFAVSGSGLEFVLQRLLLPQWQPHNRCFLASHLVGASVPSIALAPGTILDSLQGTQIAVTATSPSVVLNDRSTVLDTDIRAGSSLIHTLALPLVPDCIGKNVLQQLEEAGEDFSIFRRLIDLSGLRPILEGAGPITLFVPADDVFAAQGINVTVLEEPENRASLTVLIGYHIGEALYSLLPSADVINIRTQPGFSLLAELDAQNTYYSVTDLRTVANFTLDNLAVNNDILVSNGLAHV